MSPTPFLPVVCVVGFHHARGPEIESWYGCEDGGDPAVDNDWSFLPFMALSDGSHTATEDFSYFTLRQRATSKGPARSLFGVSCTRQMDASELINRPADVTRSTVQKAVVVIADSPQFFGQLREKLSSVTRVWFAQKDFSDVEILKNFQESLGRNLQDAENDRDQYLGLSLRELIHEFKHQTLVLFKCCLLQPKMLFFGSHCERLCMMQFSLISLIPGLIRRLEDCAAPELDSIEKNLVMPTSLKSSDRSSLLAYMGLPLQIFGKGSLFGPYTPLQQLDTLADFGTKSYIVGSTNSLLLQQKDRYSDILINLDDSSISITSSSLRMALSLSPADRRWIDFLTQAINDTWDPENPTRPKTHGYMGSEEFIRLQFEEYLLALLSCTKYHLYLTTHSPSNPSLIDSHGNPSDPSADFSPDFITHWRSTLNFTLFDTHTSPHLFDIVEPRHPTAGGLSVEDINRRLTQQISDLHLDERLATSKEVLNKHLATGSKKVSTAFNTLWADIEAMREAQRKRQAEAAKQAYEASHGLNTSGNVTPRPTSPRDARVEKDSRPSSPTSINNLASFRARTPDISAAGQKAGAYLSSWGTWASERRKGWGRSAPGSPGSGSSGSGNSSVGSRKPSDGSGIGSRPLGRANVVGREPLRSPKKRASREEKGGDGIGRLDA